MLVEPRRQGRRIERLTAEYNLAQMQYGTLGAVVFGQLLEGRRGLVQHRHLLLGQQRVEQVGRTARQIRNHNQLSAVEQRAPDLPYREIKGVRVEQRPGIVRAKAELGVGGRKQAQHVAVREQCTFRRAGGTGGVDDVGEVVRSRQRRRVAAAATGPSGVVVQPHRFAQGLRTVSQQKGWSGIFQHEGEPLCRVRGVERQVGAARFQNRQQAHDHVQRAPGAHCHQHIGTHAKAAQVMREPVGAFVELGVAHVRALETECH